MWSLFLHIFSWSSKQWWNYTEFAVSLFIYKTVLAFTHLCFTYGGIQYFMIIKRSNYIETTIIGFILVWIVLKTFSFSIILSIWFRSKNKFTGYSKNSSLKQVKLTLFIFTTDNQSFMMTIIFFVIININFSIFIGHSISILVKGNLINDPWLIIKNSQESSLPNWPLLF